MNIINSYNRTKRNYKIVVPQYLAPNARILCIVLYFMILHYNIIMCLGA